VTENQFRRADFVAMQSWVYRQKASPSCVIREEQREASIFISARSKRPTRLGPWPTKSGRFDDENPSPTREGFSFNMRFAMLKKLTLAQVARMARAKTPSAKLTSLASFASWRSSISPYRRSCWRRSPTRAGRINSPRRRLRRNGDAKEGALESPEQQCGPATRGYAETPPQGRDQSVSKKP
jgi:hypothetical protein